MLTNDIHNPNKDCWVKGGMYKYLGLGKWQYVPEEHSTSFDASKANMFDGTYDENKFFTPKSGKLKIDTETGTMEYIPNEVAKDDVGKPKLSLVPRKIIWAIAKIREYGNKKYGDPNNWRKVDVVRYRDAAYRHFMRYLDDPTGVDEESGLPHLYHLACNIAFLCELENFDEKEIL